MKAKLFFTLGLTCLLSSSLAATLEKVNTVQIVRLNTDYTFILKAKTILKSNMILKKYYLKYKDVPLWDAKLTIHEKAGKVHKSWGYVVKNIEDDLASIEPRLTKNEAINKLKKVLGIKNITTHPKAKLFIKLNRRKQAELIYLVSFISETSAKLTVPTATINANTGKVLQMWEGLNKAKIGIGPGGNEKIGKHIYGVDLDKLEVKEVGTQCSMLRDNRFRAVVYPSNDTFSFLCPENQFKEVNGAYSPINDAYFYLAVSYDMFKSYAMATPIPSNLRLMVHVPLDLINGGIAWINDNNKTLGITDGDNENYFPASNLDIIAHEVAHFYTNIYTNMPSIGQSGAVVESFSDIAGEAAKFYLYGVNDWLFGSSTTKQQTAIRYFEEPSNDGQSISHIKQWIKTLDPHYGAGVFNKAFYILAHKPQWNTKKAFEVFALGNRQYWGHNDDFHMAAEGIAEASVDLGHGFADVCDAFRQVGVSCKHYPAPGHDPIEIYNGEEFIGLHAPVGKSHLFKISVPLSSTNLSINIEQKDNIYDADLYVAKDREPTLYDFDCAPRLGSGNETCFFSTPSAGNYYIMVHAPLSYWSVNLKVNFNEASCQKSIHLTNLSGKAGSENFFSYCPTDSFTRIETHGGIGDVDLYVRKGQKPTTNEFDCRPFTEGNNEVCDLTEPGQYFIMLKGHKDYQEVTLQSRP